MNRRDMFKVLGGVALGNTLAPLLQRVRLVGRKGGSADYWGVAGDNTYLEEDAQLQMGCAIWRGEPSDRGQVSFDFPFPYTGTPLGWANESVTHNYVVIQFTVGTLGATVYWRSLGDVYDHLEFNWFAFGPR